MKQQNSNTPRLAKAVIHGKPASEISHADIEQRAREIAMINGHDPAEPRADDLEQARREMEGRSVPDTVSEDAMSSGSISRDPSIPPSIHDGPTPNVSEPSEQEDLEHLVLEGVEEAQHDQMVEASKRRPG